jgi:enoyl-CoA hydratase/carnithine racemase
MLLLLVFRINLTLGCMMAMCHDFRVMRDDRGFLCMPEVDIKVSFFVIIREIGLDASGPWYECYFHVKLEARLTVDRSKVQDSFTLRDAILLGKRFTANEALTLRMIDLVVKESQVLSESIKIAEKWASKAEDKKNFKQLKLELYRDPYDKLMSGEITRNSSASSSGLVSKL